jgi:hypothetical protein
MHGGSADTTTPAAVHRRPDRHRVRCSRTKRDGEQCKNYAMAGTTVCRKHGGTAPQTQKRARERLIEMLDPAVAALYRIIDKADTSDADRLRAIAMVLDRTGMGARSEVTVEHKKWELLMEGIMITPPPGTAGLRLPAVMMPGYSPELPILDAEVVEDEPEPIAPAQSLVRGSAEPRHERG